ncbi:MAG: SDR family oxidoreductase [Flavobacteriaceae bacterium]|nr:SDR family oxidoreductase [Flavobacteriaceae bacterium]
MSVKKIIITGAGRGIGFELVKFLASQGHQILALSRNIKPLYKLQENHPTISTLKVNISDENQLNKVSQFVNKNWNNIDIVIHNAGKLINKPFAETTVQDFIEVYKVNVFAVAELTRILLPYLKSGSHVVTISSMGGIQGSMKFPGLAAYSSSKGAVITLTELLAEEYKEQGIIFNALALGAVQTEMLAEAFPDYKAPTTATEMATYIADFALTGNKMYNGKVLQVSSTTP